jgi:hypothetical protein
MDGTAVGEVPVELEGSKGPAVLTSTRVVDVNAAGDDSPVDDCLRGPFRDARAAGPAVRRVGVSSESVSLREASGRRVLGCDNSPGDREADRRWCGSPYGVLYGVRLRDPRLGVLCNTGDGEPMGFVWVQPASVARYVAVRQPGFVEVYGVAAGLPVRVATTTGVEIEGSRASFDLSEHTADGTLLRRYRLEAAVAG